MEQGSGAQRPGAQQGLHASVGAWPVCGAGGATCKNVSLLILSQVLTYLDPIQVFFFFFLNNLFSLFRLVGSKFPKFRD